MTPIARRVMMTLAATIGSAIALLAVWFAVAAISGLPDHILPTPWQVALAARDASANCRLSMTDRARCLGQLPSQIGEL